MLPPDPEDCTSGFGRKGSGFRKSGLLRKTVSQMPALHPPVFHTCLLLVSQLDQLAQRTPMCCTARAQMCRRVTKGAGTNRAVLQAICVFPVIFAILAVGSVANTASVRGSLQEQQNAVCSYMSSIRPSMQLSQRSNCTSTVKCLINELGWPTTGAEW